IFKKSLKHTIIQIHIASKSQRTRSKFSLNQEGYQTLDHPERRSCAVSDETSRRVRTDRTVRARSPPRAVESNGIAAAAHPRGTRLGQPISCAFSGLGGDVLSVTHQSRRHLRRRLEGCLPGVHEPAATPIARDSPSCIG